MFYTPLFRKFYLKRVDYNVPLLILKKASDSVYLNGLWYKLYKKGINGKMLKIIIDMHNQVKAYVRGCNSYSDFFELAIGLKQGEVIPPLLFSFFIGDFELFLQNDPNCGLK